jgi:flagellar motility protein MotE (MotC chaperone)
MISPKNPKSQKTKSQKGTLAIVGILFLLSGVFRVATEAGQVIAQESSDLGVKAAADSDFSSLESMDLARPKHLTHALKAIQDREFRLIERENEMEERERTVEAAENAIRAELEKLQYAEDSLRETLTLASEAAENDLTQLTNMYSNMKPKQAAALFEQMEASFAAGFLYRMPADSAARVMAGMTPEKAYLVSVELAGRNADIPLE